MDTLTYRPVQTAGSGHRTNSQFPVHPDSILCPCPMSHNHRKLYCLLFISNLQIIKKHSPSYLLHSDSGGCLRVHGLPFVRAVHGLHLLRHPLHHGGTLPPQHLHLTGLLDEWVDISSPFSSSLDVDRYYLFIISIFFQQCILCHALSDALAKL